LRRVVHVGQHGQAEALPDLGEDGQRGRQAHPARGPAGGAVRLVEARLVDRPMPRRAAISFSAAPSPAHGAALHLAGAGDQGDRQVVGEAQAPDIHDGAMWLHEPGITPKSPGAPMAGKAGPAAPAGLPFGYRIPRPFPFRLGLLGLCPATAGLPVSNGAISCPECLVDF
jgi:hypothetical protein